MRWLAPVLLIGIISMPVSAAETRIAAPGKSPPSARVDELAWLEGAWEGAGIRGAPAQEIYSAPAGGTMAGHFVQADGKGGVVFYELVQITERDGSLVYRLKHFGPDLVGREEKAEVREFALVAREGDAWFFDGLTLRKDGRDRMVAAVRVGHADGSSEEYVFRYRRRR